MSTPSSPGRLLRYTLSIYRNKDSPDHEAEKFARDYVKKIAPLHARHGIEMYQTIYSPLAYRTALDAMNRRDGRGFFVDVRPRSHGRVLLPLLAELSAVTSDPEFQAFQAAEAPNINLVNAVVSLGWVETYVAGGRVVNFGEGENGAVVSAYPPWAELGDLSMAFPSGEGGEGGRTKGLAE
ncbi:hypothetical protein BJ166DRAFT_586411 [Pestalotiopsis sp. NC0098]|nr:hypothetical protein BJ166DRAFT_586411 [Pestalotiopsis sp. NC0098]